MLTVERFLEDLWVIALAVFIINTIARIMLGGRPSLSGGKWPSYSSPFSTLFPTSQVFI
jgi:hypothetical protein